MQIRHPLADKAARVYYIQLVNHMFAV